MDKVILAKNIVLDGGLGLSRPNDNQIVFGGSGTGKTMSVVLPTLYNMRNSSLIGTFAKGQIVSKAVTHFKKLKYNVHVWNLATPNEGEKIPDPMSYLCSDDDVQELARQIANGNPAYEHATKFDPYWREASESLLTGLIYYTLMRESEPTMKKVIDFFYKLQIKENGKGITTTFDDDIAWLETHAPNSVALRKLRSFQQLPYSTAGCVRDDLEKAIQNMFPISIQNAMSEDASISFESFAINKTAVFIITSPGKTTLYSFANLIFSIAIRRLMEFAERRKEKRLPRDVKLIFDDFSCGFPIHNYEKMISTFRAAAVSSLMLCQSLSQLDATYGQDNSTVIMDNCSCLVYFPGGMNKRTCSYVSEMINLPLDEIMFMELGKVIVFQPGKKPVIAERYNTFEDPLYIKFMEPAKERSSGLGRAAR